MTAGKWEDKIGGWGQFLDENKVIRALSQVANLKDICPQPTDIFRAFKECSPDNCRVIMLFQDPYPQEGIATGIAVGNKPNTKVLSPSLQVIKAAVSGDQDFDCTLKSWCRQGVLLLNSALTCRVNTIGCHYTVWAPVISDFIQKFSITRSGVVWCLFGSQAKSFKEDIKGFQHILTEYHPAYYARKDIPMSNNIFLEVNKILKGLNNEEIQWNLKTENQ